MQRGRKSLEEYLTEKRHQQNHAHHTARCDREQHDDHQNEELEESIDAAAQAGRRGGVVKRPEYQCGADFRDVARKRQNPPHCRYALGVAQRKLVTEHCDVAVCLESGTVGYWIVLEGLLRHGVKGEAIQTGITIGSLLDEEHAPERDKCADGDGHRREKETTHDKERDGPAVNRQRLSFAPLHRQLLLLLVNALFENVLEEEHRHVCDEPRTDWTPVSRPSVELPLADNVDGEVDGHQ